MRLIDRPFKWHVNNIYIVCGKPPQVPIGAPAARSFCLVVGLRPPPRTWGRFAPHGDGLKGNHRLPPEDICGQVNGVLVRVDPAGRASQALAMTLASRITRQPRAFDPAAAADLRASLPDLGPEVMGLLSATAGCSPYLRGLMLREADWLPEAVADPESALEAVLKAPEGVAPDALALALRAAKRRAALLAALCDLGGVWPLENC